MLVESLKELIGNTPVVHLHHMDFPERAGIYVKLEGMNPGGSVKDRTGMSMFLEAEKNGQIHPGTSIVEATAGNTGIGIAFAALNRGCRVIFVVPEGFSREKQVLMKALGAEIVNTPEDEGMIGARKKAEALRREIPDSISFNQFSSMANPRSHYLSTGPEIWRDLQGRVDWFVCGAGSGGTFSGTARYLKEKNPDVQCVLADPVGSVMGGGEPGDYDIEGIGNSFIADTMDMTLVDRVVKITEAQALSEVRLLASREGIFAGPSSGAAVAAARQLALGGAAGNLVCIAPDRGDRYFSKAIYA